MSTTIALCGHSIFLLKCVCVCACALIVWGAGGIYILTVCNYYRSAMLLFISYILRKTLGNNMI